MSKKIQAIRGMGDILPGESEVWQWLEAELANVLRTYGYRQIRLPIVEQTELFARSIGEVTDIVEKEMYTFDDRNGDSLTLRPEGTAGCVRAGEQHGLLFNQVQRLWYIGPMFRHERPQKGRYRQFHQVGVEAFGMAGPAIDAELILMTARFWAALGVADDVSLELNSLGTSECRSRYRDALVAYLRAREQDLDDDSRRRLDSNPLRILDSKVPETQALLADAPVLADYLDDASRSHFEQLRAMLDAAGVAYRLNPRLVRGLDYYGLTVFEWVTTALGAQGTVCAGGRYDGLVAQLGGRGTPAVGFALGLERLVLLLQAGGRSERLVPAADLYLVAAGAAGEQAQLQLAERLREAMPGRVVLMDATGAKFRAQMKRADASGAKYALVVGEDELARNEVAVKDLRGDGAQVNVASEVLADWLRARFEQAGE